MPNTKVQVEQGWLEGELLDVCTGDGQYYSFKGIPYASPPIGNLRFKEPKPPLPWEGIKKAVQHGPICPQLGASTNGRVAGSEDCLYLNVYSPNLNPKKRLSVMVFIHGGGYKFGSGNTDNYGPDFLVKHDVILVTINYRLEVLGFLCLDIKEVPGNAGLKDQVAALKWVNRNIEHFGGDPNNVTVFGESAGGASTVYHTISPMSKGLFKRAISMSGVPFCDWSIAFEPRRRAFTLGKQLGINTEDPHKLLDFLQNVSVDKLINTNPYILALEETTNIFKVYHFTPVVEKCLGQNTFINEDPEETLKKGKINDVDILIGYTSDEGLLGVDSFEAFMLQNYEKYTEMFVPRKILIRSTPEKVLNVSEKIRRHYFGEKSLTVEVMKEFITYTSDTAFIYDIHRYIRLLSKVGNAKRYLYKFSCVTERNIHGNRAAKYGLSGASHLDDTVYLFDPKIANLKLDKSNKSYRLVQLVCTLFTNFAKYGNPTPDSSLGVVWPEYDPVSQNYGDIGDNLSVEKCLNEDVVAFWKSIYDYVDIPF